MAILLNLVKKEVASEIVITINKVKWRLNDSQNKLRLCENEQVYKAGFPLAFAMSPLANQTKNWRNGICVFSPIWRNQLNDNSIPMEKHFDRFH